MLLTGILGRTHSIQSIVGRVQVDKSERLNMHNLPVPDVVYSVRARLLGEHTSNPDVELFASMSLEQCQTQLSELMTREPVPRFLKKRIRGRVRGNDFYCSVLWNAFFDFGGFTVFKGRLLPTPRGVYVTGQFRQSFGVMIVELVWIVMGLFSLLQYPDQPLRVFAVGGAFLIVWLISKLERPLRPYLVDQLRHVLNDTH